jgi:hypothetical protein
VNYENNQVLIFTGIVNEKITISVGIKKITDTIVEFCSCRPSVNTVCKKIMTLLSDSDDLKLVELDAHLSAMGAYVCELLTFGFCMVTRPLHSLYCNYVFNVIQRESDTEQGARIERGISSILFAKS